MPQEKKTTSVRLSEKKLFLHCTLRESSIAHPSTSAETVIVASSHRSRSSTCRLDAAIVGSFHRGSISRLPHKLRSLHRQFHCLLHEQLAPTFVHRTETGTPGEQLITTSHAASPKKHRCVRTAQGVRYVWTGLFDARVNLASSQAFDKNLETLPCTLAKHHASTCTTLPCHLVEIPEVVPSTDHVALSVRPFSVGTASRRKQRGPWPQTGRRYSFPIHRRSSGACPAAQRLHPSTPLSAEAPIP